jgi:hypothetical protein
VPKIVVNNATWVKQSTVNSKMLADTAKLLLQPGEYDILEFRVHKDPRYLVVKFAREMKAQDKSKSYQTWIVFDDDVSTSDELKIASQSKMLQKPDIVKGDYHLVVIDNEGAANSTMTCFDSNGTELWKKECLARGQGADWSAFAGDTPPGVYTLGECWIADPDDVKTCKPYGIYCFDLVSIKAGEIGLGREGICLHGGGSALGYPGCNADYQRLVPTFGCIRMYNADLRDVIYPLWQQTQKSENNIWVSVHQF